MYHDLTPQPPTLMRRRRVSLRARIFGTGLLSVTKRSTLMLTIAFGLYFGVAGSMMNRIDADPSFTPPTPIEGGSRAVDMAAALIERETITHRWSPNDPFFYPTAFHINMPSFQSGMMRGVGRFTLELETQIGRLRGSGAIDNDLERAAGLLQFPPDVWLFDLNQSLLPVQPADAQYRAAHAALINYNQRVARGEAVFEARSDALVMTVDRIATDLGSRAARLDALVDTDPFIINFTSNRMLYFNKGMSYAFYLLLRELGEDYQSVIAAHGLERVWAQAIDSLRRASQLQPRVVLNGSGANSIVANHLQLRGFYLKRAVLQLDEISRVVRATR